jgi:hypothetical protein
MNVRELIEVLEELPDDVKHYPVMVGDIFTRIDAIALFVSKEYPHVGFVVISPASPFLDQSALTSN